MLKVLAGDLSATFNIDGGHLQRYLDRRNTVIRSLCDQLLLHDQILVPTHDYLTAAGLICLIGEENLCSLLDTGRLRFVRLQGVFGYTRGTGPDGGLISFEDPAHKRPQDSPIEDSVVAALAVIKGSYSDHKRLVRALVEHSEGLKTASVVDPIRIDAINDLQRTTLWKPSYRHAKPDLVKLPGMGKMQVRVLGPGTNPATNVVDALLAIGLMNVEFLLSQKFECESVSTGSPIADGVALKLPRLDREHPARADLWSFLDVAGVPDLSGALLADRSQMAKFLVLSQRADAVEFRRWFHGNANLSEKDILKAYVDLLHQDPWIERLPAKSLRFAITTLAGMLPVLGAAASIIDTFIVDRLLRGRSPKFFIEDLRKFSGQIKARDVQAGR